MYKKQIQSRVRGFLQKNLLNESIDLSFVTPEILNEILKGYLICALWTEEERLNDDYESEHPNPDDEYNSEHGEDSELDKLIRLQSNMNNKSFDGFIVDDLDVDSKIQAYIDIKTFIKLSGPDAVLEAIKENGTEQLGHDIWLTRNGHGSGFFDRGYDLEDKLMSAARSLKEVDLYFSDAGRLVFSNAN